MISFTLPSAPPTFPSTLVVTVDRNPTISSSVRQLESKVDYGVLSKFRPDGENAVVKTLNFAISNITTATAKRIVDYFKGLKGSKTMVVSEDGTNVTYKVITWTLTQTSSLYSTVVVSCEEHFNAAT